jgi:hypothetical protein
VFYSNGSFVYVVVGNSAPALAVTASGTVLAQAANTSDLFVQVGLTVTAYRRSDASVIRHWTLTSPVTPYHLGRPVRGRQPRRPLSAPEGLAHRRAWRTGGLGAATGEGR